MYKSLLLFILSFFWMLSLVSAQHKVTGHYYDLFGSSIDINADNTFRYSYHFDMLGSWTKGTWSINNDTIYLHMGTVYDTIRYKGRDNRMADSLILSVDEKSEQIALRDAGILYSGGQNIMPGPMMLFYRRNRLYNIDEDGKLIRKRRRGLWGRKKYVPWYSKAPANQN